MDANTLKRANDIFEVNDEFSDAAVWLNGKVLHVVGDYEQKLLKYLAQHEGIAEKLRALIDTVACELPPDDEAPMMDVKTKNLKRALTLMQADAYAYSVGCDKVSIFGEDLLLGNPDHDQILSVLASHEQFGEVLVSIERTVEELREVWHETAKALIVEDAA